MKKSPNGIKSSYNQFHKILRLFDVLPDFPFTTSETMGNYYLSTWYFGVASRVPEQRFSKLHKMIA